MAIPAVPGGCLNLFYSNNKGSLNQCINKLSALILDEKEVDFDKFITDYSEQFQPIEFATALLLLTFLSLQAHGLESSITKNLIDRISDYKYALFAKDALNILIEKAKGNGYSTCYLRPFGQFETAIKLWLEDNFSEALELFKELNLPFHDFLITLSLLEKAVLDADLSELGIIQNRLDEIITDQFDYPSFRKRYLMIKLDITRQTLLKKTETDSVYQNSQIIERINNQLYNFAKWGTVNSTALLSDIITLEPNERLDLLGLLIIGKLLLRSEERFIATDLTILQKLNYKNKEAWLKLIDHQKAYISKSPLPEFPLFSFEEMKNFTPALDAVNTLLFHQHAVSYEDNRTIEEIATNFFYKNELPYHFFISHLQTASNFANSTDNFDEARDYFYRLTSCSDKRSFLQKHRILDETRQLSDTPLQICVLRALLNMGIDKLDQEKEGGLTFQFLQKLSIEAKKLMDLWKLNDCLPLVIKMEAIEDYLRSKQQ